MAFSIYVNIIILKINIKVHDWSWKRTRGAINPLEVKIKGGGLTNNYNKLNKFLKFTSNIVPCALMKP